MRTYMHIHQDVYTRAYIGAGVQESDGDIKSVNRKDKSKKTNVFFFEH